MHLASVAAAALGCACSAYDPFELALDPASPETWYRPQVVLAVDFMSHDDSRCVRGWFHAAGKQLDGQHDGAVPAASTLGEARDQAVSERWCLLEPAPDIAKQWFACESDYPQPGTAIYCKCQMVVPHLQYLASAEGRNERFAYPSVEQLHACAGEQGATALCQVSAGTLDAALSCTKN